MKYFKRLFIAALSLLLLACTEKGEEGQPEIILARIGDKTISKAEFIRRSEYTIRPPYARGNSNIDKKRVINSLIAEKMLALEAGEDNDLTRNIHFQRYIQGRREQAMREWLYNKEGVEKVTLDTAEVRRVYALAGRKYQVEFLSLPNKELADSMDYWLHQQGRSLDEIYAALGGGEKFPEREIEFQSPEVDVIHNALFHQKRAKGEVIGPLQIDNRTHLVMRIKGWTDRVALSDRDIRMRVKDVREKLTQQQATRIYGAFAAGLMRGKRLDLHAQNFPRFAELLLPLYLRPKEEKENKFLDKAFNRKSEQPNLDSVATSLEDMSELPLFTYDGQVWTVKQFEEAFEVHPLVFRKKNISNAEFAEQLKFAIADLLRDRELTKVAYRRGYDRVNVVRRYTNMWSDALIAQYQREEFLKSVLPADSDSLGMVPLLEKYLNPYIDELQAKFNDQIEVNVDEYDQIELTRIDMFVTQKNVPFPIMVPAFPQLTTDHRLDYGKRMEQK